MRNKFTRFPVRKTIIGIGLALLLFILLDFLFPFQPQISYSTLVQGSNGETLSAFLSKDDMWRLPMEESDISPELKKAFLAKEDRYFNYHPGINPLAMVRAFFNNILKRKRTSGASTITMQVVRLLDPAPRTYLNKFLESFRALQLEWHYSKKEIFRMYLNLVPYGGNIVGVKSAALIYFQKNANHLSVGEITTLCIIPNRPNSLKPGANSEALLASRNQWLRYFKKHRVFRDDVLADALDEPLEMERHALPKVAPHYSLWLKKYQPRESILKTFIDAGKQSKIESLSSSYMKRWKTHGINNASVVVMENATGKIIAYAGSNDFDDDANHGQVNGVIANRSPGSALKPLIYAMAFDAGLCTPMTLITDVPVNFNGYSPENYFRIFNGQVTVERALENSLNVPAVKMLNEVGVKNFTQKLEQAGFQWIGKHKSELGLSAALGGCGVTLMELTNLYRCFANKGVWSKVSYLKTMPSDTLKIPLISDASAYMLTNILCKLTRPDLPSGADNALKVKVAWKTGTSFGRRDAWSIGFNKNYTVGVWVGNFDGTGKSELSGSEMATPLLFEIFNAIDYFNRTEWFVAPASVDFRLVCSESGNLPSSFCDNTVIDMFLPGISSTEHCEHLKEVYVNADSSLSYCNYCMPVTGYVPAHLERACS